MSKRRDRSSRRTQNKQSSIVYPRQDQPYYGHQQAADQYYQAFYAGYQPSNRSKRSPAHRQQYHQAQQPDYQAPQQPQYQPPPPQYQAPPAQQPSPPIFQAPRQPQYQAPPVEFEAAPRPQPSAPPPPRIQPQKEDQNYLAGVFRRVDKNGNGEIDAMELQDALSNGSWLPFNMEVVHLMISTFDKEHRGSLTFQEFCSLWNFVTKWQDLFNRFDADRSGSITRTKLNQCLSSFGYRLSDPFYDMLMTRFDRQQHGCLYFDDFVQLCMKLQTLTAAFRDKDAERKGKILVTYEEFLQMVMNASI